jgi:hypothetical protein
LDAEWRNTEVVKQCQFDCRFKTKELIKQLQLDGERHVNLFGLKGMFYISRKERLPSANIWSYNINKRRETNYFSMKKFDVKKHRCKISNGIVYEHGGYFEYKVKPRNESNQHYYCSRRFKLFRIRDERFCKDLQNPNVQMDKSYFEYRGEIYSS